MAETDDLQNPGGDLGPPQHQFPLGLSSGLRDRVPTPGITIAQTRRSNNAINGIING